MNKPRGIIVFGANGSGKTTLGRELARILRYKHMDHEDYHFEKSEIPYTVARPYEEYLALMLADVENHKSFVLSAVTGDFGDEISRYYELAVFLHAPRELRMERIRQRAVEQYGTRVCEGGDMYEGQKQFFEFAYSRDLSRIEQWVKTLVCPVICVDGTEDWRANAVRIAKRFGCGR